MSATARNDTTPIVGVFLESVALKGIYLVADYAGDTERLRSHASKVPLVARPYFV
jgi:hypothetical protein